MTVKFGDSLLLMAVSKQASLELSVSKARSSLESEKIDSNPPISKTNPTLDPQDQSDEMKAQLGSQIILAISRAICRIESAVKDEENADEDLTVEGQIMVIRIRAKPTGRTFLTGTHLNLQLLRLIKHPRRRTAMSDMRHSRKPHHTTSLIQPLEIFDPVTVPNLYHIPLHTRGFLMDHRRLTQELHLLLLCRQT